MNCVAVVSPFGLLILRDDLGEGVRKLQTPNTINPNGYTYTEK